VSLSLSPADASLSWNAGFVSRVRDDGLSSVNGFDNRVRDEGLSSVGADGSLRVCETVNISLRFGPVLACNSSSDIS
jgi:hypothetical protein